MDGLCNWAAVRGIARKALSGHTHDAIRAALLRIARDNRPLSAESLRIELNGKPPVDRPSARDGRLSRVRALRQPGGDQ
ncbi:hypothetical protein D5S17_32875 [Pseudonocardiaceae bacterium YIM PH 21723]|nr:hypothetical protein D5S17_32875 [Pseudonocardiaceae bacterium YIM PH 21723]